MQLGSSIKLSWCVYGYFNSQFDYEDTVGGQPVFDHEIQVLRDCCATFNLIDIKSIDRYMGWNNRHMWYCDTP